MEAGASRLYRVTVSNRGTPGWSVLVRAVDEESAVGMVRSRGHEVVRVEETERPRPSPGKLRTICMNCGYALSRLPSGDAGEVTCPECGVINTPGLPEQSVVKDIQSLRGGRSLSLRLITFGLLLLVLVIIIGVFTDDLIQLIF